MAYALSLVILETKDFGHSVKDLRERYFSCWKYRTRRTRVFSWPTFRIVYIHIYIYYTHYIYTYIHILHIYIHKLYQSPSSPGGCTHVQHSHPRPWLHHRSSHHAWQGLDHGFPFHHAWAQWTKGNGEKIGGVGCVMVSPFITPEYNGRRAREKKLAAKVTSWFLLSSRLSTMDEGRGKKNWRLRLCRGFPFYHAWVKWTEGDGEGGCS